MEKQRSRESGDRLGHINMNHGDYNVQVGCDKAQQSIDGGNKDEKQTDTAIGGLIKSRATHIKEHDIQTSRVPHSGHVQTVSPEEEDSSLTGMANGPDKRLKPQEQLTADAVAISGDLEEPEYNYNEADNAGQEKTLSAPTLNNEPCKAIIKPHQTPVHQHMVTFWCLSAFVMALLYVGTLSAFARRSDLTAIGHINQLLSSILQLCVIVLCCNSLIICSLKMKKWDKSQGNTHRDHQQMRLPIDLTFGKTTSILANNTDRDQIDEEHWTTRLSLASCDTSVHTLGQTGQQTVELVTQSPIVFALQLPAECRSLKVSKLGRALFACCALSNFVTLAHPSGPVYWGTFVSGTFSTLCSYVELQLPTGLEGGHNDLSIVIVSKSLSGFSMLLSIIFAAGLLKGWLKGREKHAFVMLVLFITPGFCYLANISLIQEGHHWLEGIPLFTNICAMLVHCGITGVRGMQATPPPLLPGPRRPSPAAVRDGGNSSWRSWADAQGRWTP